MVACVWYAASRSIPRSTTWPRTTTGQSQAARFGSRASRGFTSESLTPAAAAHFSSAAEKLVARARRAEARCIRTSYRTEPFAPTLRLYDRDRPRHLARRVQEGRPARLGGARAPLPGAHPALRAVLHARPGGGARH